MERATLTVLMGPPGSGKTTWATANAAGQVVCSTDRLRTERERFDDPALVAYLRSLNTRAGRALDAGQSVIIDGCNVRRNERSRWLGMARVHRAQARLVVVHAPLQTALQVQHDRVHGVADEVMRAYQHRMHRALPWLHREGWDEVVHVEAAAAPRRWVSDAAP